MNPAAARGPAPSESRKPREASNPGTMEKVGSMKNQTPRGLFPPVRAVVILLVCGCGADGPPATETTAPPTPAASPLSESVAAASPISHGAAALPEPSESKATPAELTADEIFGLMNAAWEEIGTYTCLLDTYASDGVQEEGSVSELLFKKPGMIRMNMVEGSDAGSVVTRNREGRNRATPGGTLRLIKVTMEDNDKRHMSLRGIPFFKSDWGTILGEIRAWIEEGWKLERLPDGESEGRPVRVLGLTAPPDPSRTPPDADRQVILVCPERNLMLGRSQYLGDLLVDRDIYTKIELNPPLADDRFEL